MRASLILIALLFAADAAAESPVRIWKGKKSATTEGVVVLAAACSRCAATRPACRG
jgi:hypothetical protein